MRKAAATQMREEEKQAAVRDLLKVAAVWERRAAVTQAKESALAARVGGMAQTEGGGADGEGRCGGAKAQRLFLRGICAGAEVKSAVAWRSSFTGFPR
ncbi:hypothetical protein C2845_PM07G00120 [Panicum miliaceum]|uniref:Uncharacterized protein n=1 Tax=Panicum miliaceum TaxID=4540 RepID=A0A3L6SLS3_PANMI|nr:hypothetical protein C2845_PM07G00120 [Panicum miliaceum]